MAIIVVGMNLEYALQVATFLQPRSTGDCFFCFCFVFSVDRILSFILLFFYYPFGLRVLSIILILSSFSSSLNYLVSFSPVCNLKFILSSIYKIITSLLWLNWQRRGVVEGVDYGATGEVKKIHVSRIRESLNKDSLVIMNNLGYSSSGEVLNCK